MNASEVAEILHAMGIRPVVNAYGFQISSSYEYPKDQVRLQRGSGIAGRGDIWSMVYIASGKRIGEPCRTKLQLRRAIREYLAGPKPTVPGQWYAKGTKRGYIWAIRNWGAARARAK